MRLSMTGEDYDSQLVVKDQQEMENDDKIHAGITTVYRNAQGNYVSLV